MTFIVGKSVPRVDAADKIRGTAKYIDDINFPDQLCGLTLRSPHPCARIKSVSFGGSFDWSSVTVVTADDIQGENVFNNFNMDVPFLPKNNRVNYVGEAVLLVAAADRETAREALRHIAVDYELIAPALNVTEGLEKKCLIYGDDNILKKYTVKKGDPAKAFEEAHCIFEGTYKTDYQEQAYIEPQGMIAVPDGDGEGVTIYGSLQCPYYVRKESQKLFPFEPEKLRVVQVVTGGGFGGKEHYPSIVAAHAALLALKAGKPVKMIYDRSEDLAATSKRHPSVIRIRTAADASGRLTAADVDILFDGGAYSMASPVVLARAAIAGAGAYHCGNVNILARAVATNLIPTSAFRGFGAPQIFYAMEHHMTQMAENMGFKPYDFKVKNLLRQGDCTATGQYLKDPVGLGRCIEAVMEASDYHRLYEEYAAQDGGLKKRRGVGFSAVFHGAGFTGKGEDRIRARAGLALQEDGSVKILCGTTEMGQGMRTILVQIVAEALELPMERVSVEATDTALVPDSGPTVASRTTMIVGKVLKDAAAAALENMLEALTRELKPAQPLRYKKGRFFAASGGEAVADLVRAVSLLQEKNFYSHYESPPGIEWDEVEFRGDAYAGYGWAATVAEVEVDMETFETEVLRLISAQDMGKAINPVLVEGQIEGGCVQALGYTLSERIVLEEGRVVNDTFGNYIIPSIADVPMVEPIIVEEGYSNGPYGAKGVGEMPCVVVAPAVADAVKQATGIALNEIPLTPEKLYRASLEKKLV